MFLVTVSGIEFTVNNRFPRGQRSVSLTEANEASHDVGDRAGFQMKLESNHAIALVLVLIGSPLASENSE